jgi:hypothetical protein
LPPFEHHLHTVFGFKSDRRQWCDLRFLHRPELELLCYRRKQEDRFRRGEGPADAGERGALARQKAVAEKAEVGTLALILYEVAVAAGQNALDMLQIAQHSTGKAER